MRVPDKNAADMVNAFGMSGILIPWARPSRRSPPAPSPGVSTSAVSGVDGKFWEFLKYVYPTNHVWSSQIVTVNLDEWKKLKPEQRQAIEETAKRLEPEFWAASVKADTDSLARLKEGGMEVVEIPPAMMAEFRARSAPLLDAFLKRVPAAEKAVRAYLAEMKRSS